MPHRWSRSRPAAMAAAYLPAMLISETRDRQEFMACFDLAIRRPWQPVISQAEATYIPPLAEPLVKNGSALITSMRRRQRPCDVPPPFGKASRHAARRQYVTAVNARILHSAVTGGLHTGRAGLVLRRRTRDLEFSRSMAQWSGDRRRRSAIASVALAATCPEPVLGTMAGGRFDSGHAWSISPEPSLWPLDFDGRC